MFLLCLDANQCANGLCPRRRNRCNQAHMEFDTTHLTYNPSHHHDHSDSYICGTSSGAYFSATSRRGRGGRGGIRQGISREERGFYLVYHLSYVGFPPRQRGSSFLPTAASGQSVRVWCVLQLQTGFTLKYCV